MVENQVFENDKYRGEFLLLQGILYQNMPEYPPQLCWEDEWPTLSPRLRVVPTGRRGLGLRLGRAYGSER